MSGRTLARILGGWFALTALGCAFVYFATHIDPGAKPPRGAVTWALAALEGTPQAQGSRPHEVELDGPVVVLAWRQGDVVGKHVGSKRFVASIEEAARLLGSHRAPDVRFTVTVIEGFGPVLFGVPFISALGLVPLVEGMAFERAGHDSVLLTPEELRARRAYDGSVPTPVPDLAFGVDTENLADLLAREAGLDFSEARASGEFRRFRATTYGSGTYPRETRVTEANLRKAAVDGAEFLLRHQRADGRFTYLYDARSGREQMGVYSMPRHAGTAYFLAQVDRSTGMPRAREGAQRALAWLAQHRIAQCGAPDRLCVRGEYGVDVGSAALAAVAAAEVLDGGEDALARRLLIGLTAFLRGQQRPDGELMHEFNLQTQRPIDVQHLYYSGEAALALLRAHRVLGRAEDLAAARKLMTHLTGAGWNFLGSRYYYGEEHWTCISAGEAGDRIPSDEALDFCLRWAAFNRELQYRAGQTPWSVSGAYGVGPVIPPRLTPVASRSEAFISTYELARRRGMQLPEVRAQIERSVGMLLRYRWSPGPAHLFRDPLGARGGMPGSPLDLTARNDFVQHAGSAMLRWADVMRRERAAH